MCGIAGVLAFDEQGRQQLGRLEAAVGSLQRRGPDGNGIFRDGNLALGHTRLAIIDTSTAASQPFTLSDGRYTIIFNGEIFNFRELRQELENAGVSFRTQSDTEVLLQLFIRDGEKALPQLNGFFAFAIWDSTEKKIFLARDRYGVKPLYYYADDHVLLFGSQLKTLMALGAPKNLQHDVLLAYLQLNYVPPGESILHGTIQLHTGGWLRAGTTAASRQHGTWYRPPSAADTSPVSYADAQKDLQRELEAAVQRRLISDVPLGSFLSGGIDSSIIAALAARHTDKLHTFSIGFADEPLFDETQYARAVAKMHRTEHTVFSLTNKDLFATLFETLDGIDEPFADSSALAVSILSQRTRQHVTVALSGDGADELFAGYNKHRAEFMVQNGGLKNFVARVGKPLWSMLSASRNSKMGNRVRQLRRFAEGLSLPETERYWRWASFCTEEEAARLLVEPDSYAKKNILDWLEQENEKLHGLNKTLYNDMRLVLPGDMLVKVDRMSMLHSLEVRTPFLDVNVVDRVMRWPAEYKIDAQRQKKILKDAFAPLLPPELLSRGKQGFEVPLLRWFRGDLDAYIRELLDEKFLREQGIFKPEPVQQLLRQLASNNPGDAVARVWALVVFQHWWRKYMHS